MACWDNFTSGSSSRELDVTGSCPSVIAEVSPADRLARVNDAGSGLCQPQLISRFLTLSADVCLAREILSDDVCVLVHQCVQNLSQRRVLMDALHVNLRMRVQPARCSRRGWPIRLPNVPTREASSSSTRGALPPTGVSNTHWR